MCLFLYRKEKTRGDEGEEEEDEEDDDDTYEERLTTTPKRRSSTRRRTKEEFFGKRRDNRKEREMGANIMRGVGATEDDTNDGDVRTNRSETTV